MDGTSIKQKMRDLNPTILVPVPSENGLNAPIKRQSVRFDKNAGPMYMWLIITVF